jgi:site-specific DNA-methyltransferase (adenine-specific)
MEVNKVYQEEFVGRAKLKIYNADCMDYMRGYEDNEFELAIVDPPYGIGFDNYNRTESDKTEQRFKRGNWDKVPVNDYFIALQRISQNQIVWGGNYFPYLWRNGCKGFIFWYKNNPVNNFADGELAWTSFNKVAKQFNYTYYGNKEGTSLSYRIHPTQKPIELYKWLLNNYAKQGDKILDTHFGSGSIAIACWDMEFDLTAFEIDKDYFEAAIKRIKEHTAQRKLF